MSIWEWCFFDREQMHFIIADLLEALAFLLKQLLAVK